MSIESLCAAAVLGWLPPVTPAIDAIEKDSCADIESVVEDVSEPAVWNMERDALTLAWLGRLEGGYTPIVDDGRCNDPKWRAKHKKLIESGIGMCDGGHAYSQWQIHPGEGIALIPGGGYVSWPYIPAGLPVIHGSDLIADRRLAVRVALHIIRQSVIDRGNLTGYTGERGSHHPKADLRMNTPRAYEETWRTARDAEVFRLLFESMPTRYPGIE